MAVSECILSMSKLSLASTRDLLECAIEGVKHIFRIYFVPQYKKALLIETTLISFSSKEINDALRK